MHIFFKNSFYTYCFAVIILLLGGCRSTIEDYVILKSASSAEGMVVTAHPLATKAGIDILNQGGNAADAAVAVQLALAVVYPRAGNIGGGGFVVYRENDGDVLTLDFRETAPAAAYSDMFLDSTGNIIQGLSMEGILAVGIPGTVAGLAALHDSLGSMEWSALVAPAISFAANGFKLTELESARLNAHREKFLKHNSPDMPFISSSGEWEKGDLLVQKKLAAILEQIAIKGRAGFYEGQNAQQLVQTSQSLKGIITIDDLKSYLPIWRKVLTINWREYKLYTMGLPSSGGIILHQVLHMIDNYLNEGSGPKNKENIHVIVEAERRAFADRALYLGDMDHYDVPVDSLLSSAYLHERFQDYNPGQASESGSLDSINYFFTKEKFETTHFSIVDKFGNAASMTTTLNGNYGSLIWLPNGGYFLNNEMDDFSIKPGTPNQFGLIGAKANAIAPKKRMLSSMTPTIVERNDQLFMVLGTPGGSTIPSSVLHVFLNHSIFTMDITKSVEELRYHHQWLPDEIMYERGSFSDTLVSELETMGHTLREVEVIGLIDAISVDSKGIRTGAADPRGDDHAKGQ